jgi:amino acid transporter
VRDKTLTWALVGLMMAVILLAPLFRLPVSAGTPAGTAYLIVLCVIIAVSTVGLAAYIYRNGWESV